MVLRQVFRLMEDPEDLTTTCFWKHHNGSLPPPTQDDGLYDAWSALETTPDPERKDKPVWMAPTLSVHYYFGYASVAQASMFSRPGFQEDLYRLAVLPGFILDGHTQVVFHKRMVVLVEHAGDEPEQLSRGQREMYARREYANGLWLSRTRNKPRETLSQGAAYATLIGQLDRIILDPNNQERDDASTSSESTERQSGPGPCPSSEGSEPARVRGRRQDRLR